MEVWEGMRIRETNKKEIVEKLATLGDYVRMEYLSHCLKQALDYDTKKFVLVTLSQLYESRGMLLEAGKMMRAAADINTTPAGKISDYIRSIELLIKSRHFLEVDASMNRALANASERQRKDIRRGVIALYLLYARDCLKKDRRKHAIEAYERVLTFNDLDAQQRQDIHHQLLSLYERLGKMNDYFSLKRIMK